MRNCRRFPAVVTCFTALLALVGCWKPSSLPQIRINGSSTVYPISEAVAEEFAGTTPGISVEVGFSGTGGGMKKFHAGEIDICDASREITEQEAQLCEEAGIPFVELSVAYDGLAVVVHPANDWCDSLTVEQLKQIWRPDEPAEKWSDLDPAWPDEKIVLYGPGTDSGTFEYFTEVVVGEKKSCRSDYAASEDDNTLVTGVSGDKHALGYFGFAYFTENQERLKLLAIDNGDGPIQPALKTIMDNSYNPLSRPLYIYVNANSLQRPEVAEFVAFYLDQADALAEEIGYVPVPAPVAMENVKRLSTAR